MFEENDLNDFESALRTLRPVAGGANPVSAAFTAGQRTRQRSVRRWQGAAVIALMLGLAGHLPRPERAGRPELPQPLARSSEPIAPARSEQSLQFLQQTTYERGIDALPQVQLPPLGALRVNGVL